MKKRNVKRDFDSGYYGKVAADMTGAPSIRNAKPAKKTNVKYDKHMKMYAPTIKKA